MLQKFQVGNNKKASEALSVVIRILNRMSKMGPLYRKKSTLFRGGNLGLLPGFKGCIAKVFGLIFGVDYSIEVEGFETVMNESETIMYGMDTTQLKQIGDNVKAQADEELLRIKKETARKKQALQKTIDRCIQLFEQLNQYASAEDVDGVKNILGLIRSEMSLEMSLKVRDIETGILELSALIVEMRKLVSKGSPESKTFSCWLKDLKKNRKSLYTSYKLGFTEAMSLPLPFLKSVPEQFTFELDIDALAEAIVQQSKEKK